MYGRVKLAKLDFLRIKDSIVDWLRQDLYWMKEDYIQAKRISNIGLLVYTYNVVDRDGTRKLLEQAVSNKIQRVIILTKYRCKLKDFLMSLSNPFSR